MARNPWSPHLDSITWGPNTIAARFPTALKPKKELSYQTIENRRFGITVNSLKEVSFLGWQTGASTFPDRRPIITQDDTDWLKRSKNPKRGVKDFSFNFVFVSDSLSCIRPVKCINPRISQAWFTVAKLKCIKGRKFLKTSTVMNDAYRMPRTT